MVVSFVIKKRKFLATSVDANTSVALGFGFVIGIVTDRTSIERKGREKGVGGRGSWEWEGSVEEQKKLVFSLVDDDDKRTKLKEFESFWSGWRWKEGGIENRFCVNRPSR